MAEATFPTEIPGVGSDGLMEQGFEPRRGSSEGGSITKPLSVEEVVKDALSKVDHRRGLDSKSDESDNGKTPTNKPAVPRGEGVVLQKRGATLLASAETERAKRLEEGAYASLSASVTRALRAMEETAKGKPNDPVAGRVRGINIDQILVGKEPGIRAQALGKYIEMNPGVLVLTPKEITQIDTDDKRLKAAKAVVIVADRTVDLKSSRASQEQLAATCRLVADYTAKAVSSNKPSRVVYLFDENLTAQMIKDTNDRLAASTGETVPRSVAKEIPPTPKTKTPVVVAGGNGRGPKADLQDPPPVAPKLAKREELAKPEAKNVGVQAILEAMEKMSAGEIAYLGIEKIGDSARTVEDLVRKHPEYVVLLDRDLKAYEDFGGGHVPIAYKSRELLPPSEPKAVVLASAQASLGKAQEVTQNVAQLRREAVENFLKNPKLRGKRLPVLVITDAVLNEKQLREILSTKVLEVVATPA